MVVPDWQHAECKGMDTNLFFMNREELQHEGLTPNNIRRVCADCVIRKDCLTYAFKYERHGLWGGITAEERDLIRRNRLTDSRVRTLLRDLADNNISLNSIIEFIGAESDFLEPRDYMKAGAYE
jgi:hypothetical protein